MAANRELSPRERQIRSNIRNAYFAENQEVLERELDRRREREDRLAVMFLQELINERQKEFDDVQAMRMDTVDML